MGKRGRRRTVVSIVVALLVVAPAAAQAAKGIDVRPVGSLTIQWQGDPARGCAAEGLCGVTGSLAIAVGDSSNGGGPGVPPIQLSDNAVTVRVVQSTPTGAPISSCASVSSVYFSLALRRTAYGMRAVVSQAFGLPSAGRCAGPTAGDLDALTLPVHTLGAHDYNLSGTDAFGAGPFEVTVVSHVRVLVSTLNIHTVRPPTIGPGPLLERHTELRESATVVYRIAGVTGSLGATFSGVQEPLCEALGSCGAAGSVTLTPVAGKTELTVSSSRTVKRRVDTRAALADLRAGRLRAPEVSSKSLDGTLTGTLAQPGLPACQDSVDVPAIVFDSDGFGQGRLSLDLGGGGPFFLPGSDALRSRCPGPTSSDIDPIGPLASGSLPVGELGQRQLTLTVSSSGAFSGDGYVGTRDGTVTLDLVRVRESGGTTKVKYVTVAK